MGHPPLPSWGDPLLMDNPLSIGVQMEGNTKKHQISLNLGDRRVGEVEEVTGSKSKQSGCVPKHFFKF